MTDYQVVNGKVDFWTLGKTNKRYWAFDTDGKLDAFLSVLTVGYVGIGLCAAIWAISAIIKSGLTLETIGLASLSALFFRVAYGCFRVRRRDDRHLVFDTQERTLSTVSGGRPQLLYPFEKVDSVTIASFRDASLFRDRREADEGPSWRHLLALVTKDGEVLFFYSSPSFFDNGAENWQDAVAVGRALAKELGVEFNEPDTMSKVNVGNLIKAIFGLSRMTQQRKAGQAAYLAFYSQEVTDRLMRPRTPWRFWVSTSLALGVLYASYFLYGLATLHLHSYR